MHVIKGHHVVRGAWEYIPEGGECARIGLPMDSLT